MASDLLGKMTLTRWIIAAVIIAAIVLFYLFNFTTFQIPKTITEGKRTYTEDDYKLKVQPYHHSCTNLDHVYNKIHNKPECGSEQSSEGANNE